MKYYEYDTMNSGQWRTVDSFLEKKTDNMHVDDHGTDSDIYLEERVRDDPTPESRRSRGCGAPSPGLLSSGYVQWSSFICESPVSSAVDCCCSRWVPGGDDRLSRQLVESGLVRCDTCGDDAVAADSSSLSSSRVRSEFTSKSSTAMVNVSRKSDVIQCILIRLAINNRSNINFRNISDRPAFPSLALSVAPQTPFTHCKFALLFVSVFDGFRSHEINTVKCSVQETIGLINQFRKFMQSC